MQTISEDVTASTSPVAIDIPISSAKRIKRNSSSDGSDSMFVLDGTPPANQTSHALSALSLNCIEYTESVADDVDDILEMKEKEFKGVNFIMSTPTEVAYQVSHDIHEEQLRKPGKLFPSESQTQWSPHAQEVVNRSNSLQIAASNAVVKMGGSGSSESESEMKDDKSSKKKKKKKKRFRKKDKIATPRTSKLIGLYIQQGVMNKDTWSFDLISKTESNGKTMLLSSKGLSKGLHEWSIEIWRSDVELQEIGVIGTSDIDRVPVSDKGAVFTKGFLSRAFYGCDMEKESLFYGSYNADGQKRCHRDLTEYFQVGWTVNDVVTIKLDLNRWRIKFLLNGQPVRHTMSVEPNKEYFPSICFSGNCKYYLK